MSFDKSSVIRLEDVIPDAEFSMFFSGGITVAVNKVGGGDPTRSRRYEGTWEYWYFVNGTLVKSGSDLTSGVPKTHEEMCWIALDFLDHRGELGK